MRKIGIQLLLIFVLLAGIGYYVWQHWELRTVSPIQAQIVLDNPYKIKSDAQGDVYVINKAKTNILKIGRDGTIKDKIELPAADDFMNLQLASGSDPVTINDEEADLLFVACEDLVVDSQGYMYALVHIFDENVLLLRYETVIRFTPDGQLDESWGGYARAHDAAKSDSLSDGTILGLEMRDDALYMVTQDQEDQLYVSRWLADKMEWQRERMAYIKPGQYIAGMTGLQAHEMYFATRSGELYNDDFKLLYPLEGYMLEQPK
ncbi:MAG: hypothetical protein WCC10_10275, partial [Tumebacillaceae bacterium]